MQSLLCLSVSLSGYPAICTIGWTISQTVEDNEMELGILIEGNMEDNQPVCGILTKDNNRSAELRGMKQYLSNYVIVPFSPLYCLLLLL